MTSFNIPESNDIKVPFKNPVLKLVGTDSNAFALMGKAISHNKTHKIYNKQDLDTILAECMSAGYDHLLSTLMHFFRVR